MATVVLRGTRRFEMVRSFSLAYMESVRGILLDLRYEDHAEAVMQLIYKVREARDIPSITNLITLTAETLGLLVVSP